MLVMKLLICFRKNREFLKKGKPKDIFLPLESVFTVETKIQDPFCTRSSQPSGNRSRPYNRLFHHPK
jgi:hypothetical protein